MFVSTVQQGHKMHRSRKEAASCQSYIASEAVPSATSPGAPSGTGFTEIHSEVHFTRFEQRMGSTGGAAQPDGPAAEGCERLE